MWFGMNSVSQRRKSGSPLKQLATIVDLASKARVPAIYPEREYAEAGGLIAYGANVPEHFRQAASYVDRILRGANLAISHSTHRRNSILSSTSGLPVRLD
jgi:ABC-type uncharacterized transport system substrate-binding protein